VKDIRFFRAVSVAFFVAAGAEHLLAQESQSVCIGLLTHTGRDQFGQSRDTEIAQNLYREHCEGSTSKATNRTDVGIEAVIKAVPVKFSLGTGGSKDKLNTFCKISSDQNLMRERLDTASSTVVREALAAFNECVARANTNVFFDVNMSKEDLTIGVFRGRENTRLMGVEYDAKKLNCTIAKKDRSEIADSNTRENIEAATSIPVHCVRKASDDKSGLVTFDDATVTVLTDRGNLKVPVPADAKMPSQWVSDLNKTVADTTSRLNDHIESLKTKLEATKLDCAAHSIETGQVRNPDGQVDKPITVYIPDQYRATHVLVGGSCEISKWYQDRPANGGGGPTADNIGWQCRAGDPPNMARVLQMRATVRFCRLVAGPA
jgi:hypothetical protein